MFIEILGGRWLFRPYSIYLIFRLATSICRMTRLIRAPNPARILLGTSNMSAQALRSEVRLTCSLTGDRHAGLRRLVRTRPIVTSRLGNSRRILLLALAASYTAPIPRRPYILPYPLMSILSEAKARSDFWSLIWSEWRCSIIFRCSGRGSLSATAVVSK